MGQPFSQTLRLRSVRVAFFVAALLGVGLCFSALLGSPGVESALVLGVILPPFCAAIGVRVVDAQRGAPALVLLVHAMTLACLTLLIPIALFTLNMLRVPVCEPLLGYAFLALGPGAAVLLAAAVGVLIGAYVPRVRVATTLAVLTPIGFALVEIFGFYATPAIFGYGHFFGYFPGTLYDPDITIGVTYVSYRMLTFVWWAAIASGLAATWDPETRRASYRQLRERWQLGVLCIVLVVGGLALEGEGHRLGHFSTAGTIAEALGGRRDGERCTVIYPRELPRTEAQRLADDCDFRVNRVERVLGVRQTERITAFFFRSSDEKRALMGASSTYVAKPWRREVYLQISDWPHPVLFHEVVHVVAGNIGVGPFRVAGGVGGLLPSPAIIEGVAVAVAWGEREGLTPHQWARAMLDIGLAPPLTSVEGLEFMLQPASRAYTTSGSFVRWLMDTEGTDVVRRLYLSGDWEQALGRPLAEAEVDWHRFLREEVELPEEARALAQARFERPGIFGSICPHAIANLRTELGGALAAGDDAGASERCRSILSLDEGQAYTRAMWVGALARLGQIDHAERELDRLIGPPSASLPVLQYAQQELGDALWRTGESGRARTIYQELLQQPMGESAARQLDVRVLATRAGGEQERALRELLAPPRGVTADAATAMFAVAKLGRVRDDGLASYLSARQLLFRRRFDLALPEISDARASGLPTERLRAEARRMEAMIRFGAGEIAASARLWREILGAPESTEGDRVTARDWLARCRHAATE